MMKAFTLALVLLAPLASRAGGNCGSTPVFRIEGYRASDKTLLLSATVRAPHEVEGSTREVTEETSAWLVELKLDSPDHPRALWMRFYDKLFGERLVAALAAQTKRALVDAYAPVTAPQLKGKERRAGEVTFEEPGGRGEFIVRKLASWRFELAHRASGATAEVLLEKDLLRKPAFNPAGIQVESLLLLDGFVVGLAHYCGEPVLWARAFETP